MTPWVIHRAPGGANDALRGDDARIVRLVQASFGEGDHGVQSYWSQLALVGLLVVLNALRLNRRPAAPEARSVTPVLQPGN